MWKNHPSPNVTGEDAAQPTTVEPLPLSRRGSATTPLSGSATPRPKQTTGSRAQKPVPKLITLRSGPMLSRHPWIVPLCP